MDLKEAKDKAQKDNSAQVVKFRKSAKTVGTGIAIGVFILVALLLWGTGPYQAPVTQNPPASVAYAPPSPVAAPQTTVPLESAGDAAWPMLFIEPGGRTPDIAVPPNMHIVVKGDGALIHTKFWNGQECTYGKACKAGSGDGPIRAVYVTNESATGIYIRYAFAYR